MANDDAWQAGIDIAAQRQGKQGQQGQGKEQKQKLSKPVGQVTTSDGQTLTPSAPMKLSNYHKGGKVKKTGPANLRKGEIVMTAKQQQKAGLKKGKKKASAKKRVASKG
jgi:hypothetical protein